MPKIARLYIYYETIPMARDPRTRALLYIFYFEMLAALESGKF
jgi:hypothetical protein